MDFQIYTTSCNIQKYIPILENYNLTIRNERYYITIKDLSELVKFKNEIDEELIFYDGVLEIYDDYRE